MPLNTPDEVVSTKAGTAKAALIYGSAHYSASSLLAAFQLALATRGNPRGITTDQEQDLLRAMLVMACAGLDATIKQLIRDAMLDLAHANEDVCNELEKFIARQIKSEEDGKTSNSGAAFLAKVLASSEPRKRVISNYVYELTGDSLQSHAQVMKAASALGLTPAELELDLPRLRDIFLLGPVFASFTLKTL